MECQHSEDAGEEQQQRRQVACRLWALFAVLAGAVGPAVVVLVVAGVVGMHQLTVTFGYW